MVSCDASQAGGEKWEMDVTGRRMEGRSGAGNASGGSCILDPTALVHA
jgi:hypothetical protein